MFVVLLSAVGSIIITESSSLLMSLCLLYLVPFCPTTTVLAPPVSSLHRHKLIIMLLSGIQSAKRHFTKKRSPKVKVQFLGPNITTLVQQIKPSLQLGTIHSAAFSRFVVVAFVLIKIDNLFSVKAV